MKKVIVDSEETITIGPFELDGPTFSGWRLKQIENSILFPVGEPKHFWANCPDEANLNDWWYDFNDNTVKKIPYPILSEPLTPPGLPKFNN
jgi:hypothetical protein